MQYLDAISNNRMISVRFQGKPINTTIRSDKLLSRVRLFAIPWISARQAFLSITNSGNPPKLMSTVLVMPSNYLILCRPHLLLPQIFPRIRVFWNESALHLRWPNIGVSALASVLPTNTQDWSPLGWSGWISCSPRDSQVCVYIYMYT